MHARERNRNSEFQPHSSKRSPGLSSKFTDKKVEYQSRIEATCLRSELIFDPESKKVLKNDPSKPSSSIMGDVSLSVSDILAHKKEESGLAEEGEISDRMIENEKEF